MFWSAQAYLLFCPLFCAAQTLPHATADIEVTSRLVQINVLVHEKKGLPITGLKQEDFELSDNNKVQKIRVFRTSSPPSLKSSPLQLPPNVFSNRRDNGSDAAPNMTVILMDVLNTQFLDQTRAKQQVLKFLTNVQPEDRIAIYVLGRKLFVLHDFTDDAAHLSRTLAKLRVNVHEYQPSNDSPITADTGLRDLDVAIENANRLNALASDFRTAERARLTTQAMEDIANHVATIPGRKSLVWVSGAFPFALGIDTKPYQIAFKQSHDYGAMDRSIPIMPRVFNAEMQAAIGATNQAGLAIYPVDTRGLSAPEGMADASSRNSQGSDLNPGFGSPYETMDILADRTGGVAFRNVNHLDKAIRQALDDGRVTYTLGYYPAADAWDGKFHKIAVNVKRKGVRVRYAKGYFALPETNATGELRKRHIEDALLSPLDATVIGLGARIDPASQPAPDSFRVVVQVDSSDLTLKSSGNTWTGSVEYVLMEQATDGAALHITTETLNLNLNKQKYDAIMRGGLLLTAFIKPAPQAYRLRAVILDRPSGNLGSISIALPATRAAQHN